jgi:acetoin utilization protein AcuB
MWMTPDPVTVEPSAPVSEVARLMALRHVRRIVVTEPGSHGLRVVGIASSHDVWQACPAGFHPFSAAAWPAGDDPGVGTIMSAAPHTTTPDTPIEDAARLLRKHKIGALPVLRAGRLVGIITESDLLDVLLEMTGASEPGVRVSFEVASDDDVVRRLLDVADRHGMRLASMLTFRHPGRDESDGLRLGVARLLGRERPELIDDVWANCSRVRRVLRSDPQTYGAHQRADGQTR